MKAFAAALCASLALVAGAAADVGHDPYITGTIVGRAPGENASNVVLRWNLRCFEDEYGDATFSYTIVLTRILPQPQQRTTLTRGTARGGSTNLRLKPGLYRPDADPFRCEAGINFVATDPEQGAPFIVPDYCALETTTLRGAVNVIRARNRVALEAGVRVRPGETIAVAPRGSATFRDDEGSGIQLAAGTRVTVEKGTCATRGGWQLLLRDGSVRADARSRAPHVVRTARVTASAANAAWTVAATAAQTRVAVSRGRVEVRARGRTTTVRAGTSFATP